MLLPVRNGARHLPECIRSLRAQTLEEVEFVVVDDHSSDGTGDILDAWAKEDRRVRLLWPREASVPALGSANLGDLVACLERARAAARAPLLARMDHDDVALPERLARQLELMDRQPDVALCGCGVEYFRSGRVGDGSLRYESWLNALIDADAIEQDLFVECPVAHPTFMMRREAVEAVGGYRDLDWPEDYDLLIRLWEAGMRFAKVPEVLLRWRDRPDRLSRTSPRYGPSAFRRLKVCALRRTLLAGREEVIIWGAGPTGKAFSRALTGAGVGVRAFVDPDPRKVGQEIHGAPVVPPEDVDTYRGIFCLAAVAKGRGREEIRSALGALGWREMLDFCAVA